MFEQFIRIGLLRGLTRNALRRLIGLFGILCRPTRTGLAYVWRNRCQILAFMKNCLEVLKLVFEVIKNIRTLLCDTTAHSVQVAG